MAKINLPKEVLQKESFKALPAKEKEEYLRNLLKKILEINPEGVTISQIKEATDFTYSTVWHHLEILSCTAQCHKLSRGNLDIYHPTGKSVHLNDYNKGNVLYTISTIEEARGKFVSVHEKRENKAGSQTVVSGIGIPVELIGNIVETLNKVKGKSKGVTAEELLEEGMLKKERAKAEEFLAEGMIKKEETNKSKKML